MTVRSLPQVACLHMAPATKPALDMPSDALELRAPDLILMLLAAETRHEEASGRVNGIVRLQKLLFLAGMECDLSTVKDPFVFAPFYYGPYSAAVEEAVQLLGTAGLLTEERPLCDSIVDRAEELMCDVTNEIGFERQFALTDTGQAVARYLLCLTQASTSPHSRPRRRAAPLDDLPSQLTRLKDAYADMPINALIYRCHAMYPHYSRRENTPTFP